MITIELPESYEEIINQQWLEDAVQSTFLITQTSNQVELTLCITDDAEIQTINQQYRGIDAPTDVLSFPSGGEINPENNLPYLGDIIISLPRAQNQANLGGHPLKEEIQLLTIHGILHLLGRDHAEEDEKQEMWGEQKAVLQALGCSITGPANE